MIQFAFHDTVPLSLLPEHNRRWNFTEKKRERIEKYVNQLIGEEQVLRFEDLKPLLQNICERTLCSGVRLQKKAVYWWTPQIAGLRKQCMVARRKLKRLCRRNRQREIEIAVRELKILRLEFKKEIAETKRKCWEDLCKKLDCNPWGDAFRIVTGRFGRVTPKLLPYQVDMVVDKLFPKDVQVRYKMIQDIGFEAITEEELLKAAKRLNRGKSPGLDGVPVEIVQIICKLRPKILLNIYNKLLENGSFPYEWKKARLVLLKKGNKPDGDPSGYRPLCLLDSTAKLFEHVIHERLKSEFKRIGDLHKDQHGFRVGKSTETAIKEVMRRVDEAANGTRSTRRIPALLALDIRNAFNSAPWSRIIDALEVKGIKKYLLRILQDYFCQRSIISSFGKQYEMSCGVAQGSILGPTLWNVFYDSLLLLMEGLADGVSAVAYADDLAIIVVAKTEEEVMTKANLALQSVCGWLTANQLQIAPEKTEAIVFSGRRKLSPIRFEVQGHTVEPSKNIKYLGVWLDCNRNFSTHVAKSAAKATRTAQAVIRLMSSTRGPKASKKKLHASVAISVALYGAPCWRRALKKQRNCDRLEAVQRMLALRVTSAYRTVSTDAVLLLAGMAPVKLQVEERCATSDKIHKKERRKNTLDAWQNIWESSSKGAWTRRLIPNVSQWLGRKHGELDHWLSQMLTGHGKFEEYLFRFKKRGSPKCQYCEEIDNVEHTFWHCRRWQNERITCSNSGVLEQPENFVDWMLKTNDNWRKASTFAHQVLTTKALEEQRGTRPEER